MSSETKTDLTSSGREDIGRDYSGAHAHAYHFLLGPAVLRFLDELPLGARVLDAGCGNGVISGMLMERGYKVTGVDVSTSGIEICKATYPDASFHVASVCDPGIKKLVGDQFDAVIAVEVIEHIYAPAEFIQNCRELLRHGGVLVLTTPYHGYLKNLGLAMMGKLDRHHQPRSEGGHIKFWSRQSLTEALEAGGFDVIGFQGCGRLPWLWRSMALKARKPV